MTAPITPLLLDTDVLIDYLRGRPEAIDYVDTLTNPLFVSVITVGELYAGVRDGAERSRLDTFLLAFTIIPVDQAIAVTGGLLRRDFGKSHGTGLADALIAATAQVHGLTVVSLNRKHFSIFPSLVVPY
ncbi:MAG: type II toxin-antitoxin system VapC family toxin [Ardenticatenaceae bacterium]|nr:type II toxin-antitoxin system VapC family toxin [Ardenticatenaceae bacterium]